MSRKLEVSNLDDIKVVIDPFRTKIMKYLRDNGPSTVKQLGDGFNEAPSKMLYHIKKLKEIGAVDIVRTEVINGIIAKYYDVIVDEVSIAPNKEDEESLKYVKIAMESQWVKYYDNAKEYAYNLFKESDPKEVSDDFNGVLGELYIYLNKEEINELSSELTEVIKKYSRKSKENRHKYHVLKSILRVE